MPTDELTMTPGEAFGPDWDQLDESDQSVVLEVAIHHAGAILTRMENPRYQAFESVETLASKLDQLFYDLNTPLSAPAEFRQSRLEGMRRVRDGLVSGRVPFPSLSGDEVLAHLDQAAKNIRRDAEADGEPLADAFANSFFDHVPNHWLERNGVKFEWAGGQVMKRLGLS
jgi:hypothetical protein